MKNDAAAATEEVEEWSGEIIIRYTCKLESGQIDAVEEEEEENGKPPRDKKHLGENPWRRWRRWQRPTQKRSSGVQTLFLPDPHQKFKACHVLT